MTFSASTKVSLTARFRYRSTFTISTTLSAVTEIDTEEGQLSSSTKSTRSQTFTLSPTLANSNSSRSVSKPGPRQ
jgi:hypothetical protein